MRDISGILGQGWKQSDFHFRISLKQRVTYSEPSLRGRKDSEETTAVIQVEREYEQFSAIA